MAAEDFAIVTGVSWYPAGGFAELFSPPNDVELFTRWLNSPDGGDVPMARILPIVSPEPRPTLADPSAAEPTMQSFDNAFFSLLKQRMAMGPARVCNRLYLYFSGHGFASRSHKEEADAALYCANAELYRYAHIYGTAYGRIARSYAIFKEVVLIMDCCRDAVHGRSPQPLPYYDSPDDELEAKVSMLACYAAPRGEQTPERMIPERGRIHGVLTHGLIKVLEETTAPTAQGLSGNDIKQFLEASWPSIAKTTSSVMPVIIPTGPPMYFAAPAVGNFVTFNWQEQPMGATLTIKDHSFTVLATVDLHTGTIVEQHLGKDLLQAGGASRGAVFKLAAGLFSYHVEGTTKEVHEILHLPGGPYAIDF